MAAADFASTNNPRGIYNPRRRCRSQRDPSWLTPIGGKVGCLPPLLSAAAVRGLPSSALVLLLLLPFSALFLFLHLRLGVGVL